MKNLVMLLLAAATMYSFSSCKKVAGEGPVETENRRLNNFSGISVNIGGTIYFSQAPDYKVEIIAQRNILNLIETYKSGNDLILKFKNNVNISNHTEMRINISAPSLERVHLSGSGNINITGNFAAPQLNATISGSGNLTIDQVQLADALTVGLSGSGNIRVLNGMAAAEKVTVSGSGFIDLSGVKAFSANVTISGSGTAKVNVTHTLDATIAGSGNVFYFNNPVINAHISGSGKVVRL
jgi:Putative auto-transporter adhesin, head GIN domain